MRRSLLILALAPIVFVAGLFTVGFVHGLLRGSPTQVQSDGSPTQVKQDRPPAHTEPVEPGSSSPTTAPQPAPSQAKLPTSVPSDLTTATVATFLVESGLWRVQDESLVGDAAGFAALALDDAVRLHTLLADGGDELQGVRLNLFAWLAHLPPQTRAAFCEQVGAVHPAGFFTGRVYRGDFMSLFYLQTNDADSIFAVAVRRYAEVLESDAIIDALKQFGAILVEPDDGTWRLRVESKLKDFDATTLLALRENIDLFFGLGDRKYLRAELADLAASKTSQDK